MTSKIIRNKFIKFFTDKGHINVPPSPVINKEDPTLMFTNAGMNQFKDFFLGNKKVVNSKVVDTQPCLRVSGKHNDLEEVGKDTYHHTLFEMLGNWSFGDYFKKDAISWAWELLTKVYSLNKDRLYVTVFEGDKTDGLDPDTESFNIWKKFTSEDRILYCSKKDNFWEMGETGPCGPCSEIHIDIRSEEDRQKINGKDLVNKDHPQVVEIWNLVFIQYNRLVSGKLEELPKKHIDTGMGFERLAMVIQNKTATYDTDVFSHIIDFISEKSKVKYGENNNTDIAIRVIADHCRAVSVAIADGQIPSNNQAGYVIRRILRRAIRYGYSYLGFDSPFIYELVPFVAEHFIDVVPSIKEQVNFISKIIKEEETAFLRTLTTGLKRIDQILKNSKDKTIEGQDVFELYDTYGFPPDLTSLILSEDGYKMDENGFNKAMNIQKTRSQKDASIEQGDWIILHPNIESNFIGYDHLFSKSKIIKYQKVNHKGKEFFKIVLDRTPFYAEGGGQVGDTGFLEGENKISILDTKKENGLIVHYIEKLPQKIETTFNVTVNIEKRKLTENNHSATHLMQSALKTVLGSHVAQKGSLVSKDLLRFDFSHFAKLSREEIQQVENIVNQKIRENIKLDEKRDIPIKEAKKMGATALFGEKYGDKVRVITFDEDFSRELCGGTHVKSTGQIGIFKIVSESSIAAGIRRIEAVTAKGAEDFISNKLNLLDSIESIFNNPKDTLKHINQVLLDHNSLSKNIESLLKKLQNDIKKDLVTQVEVRNSNNIIIQKLDLPNPDILKSLAFELKKDLNPLFLVLVAKIENKPHIAVMISDEILSKIDKNANSIIKELAKHIKGGGGGQPFFATAGGSDLNGIDKVVVEAKNIVKHLSF